MKLPHSVLARGLSHGLTPTLVAIALMALPGQAPGDELLRYSFEDLEEPLFEGSPVMNTAPDALGDGQIFGFSLARASGNTVSIDGVIYNLGQSLDLFPGNGTEGRGAAGVDTLLFLSELGIGGASDYTAMAWANFANQAGDNMIFGGESGNALHLGARGGAYHHGHWGDDITVGTTEPNEWRHVAYTHQGSTGIQAVFVDGVQIGQGAGGGATENPLDQNLLIGTSLNGGSYVGLLDEVKVFDELLDAASIKAASIQGLPVRQLPFLSGGFFSERDEVTLTLEDLTGVVDASQISLEIDMVEVDPAEFTVEKTGTTTTIVYTFPGGEPPPVTSSNFTVTGMTTAATGGQVFQVFRTVTSFSLPDILRAGLDPAPNGTWNLIEFRSEDFPASVPTTIGSDAQGYRDVLEIVAEGTITAQGNAPVLNHWDPEAGGGGGAFHPNLPFLSDQPGDDNHFVIFGRTILTIPAGEEGTYTFHVTGDDGYALRIEGANFLSIAGTGGNQLDANVPATAYFPAGTGNSNAFIVAELPAPGNYLIEFVGYEIGGGAYQELSFAPGAHTSLGGTSQWELVGDPASQVPALASPFVIPDSIIPQVTSQGGWATHIWYGAMRAGGTVRNLSQLAEFLRDVEFGGASFVGEFVGSLPTLNHQDSGGGGVFGDNQPFPEAPNPGFEDNVAMIARGSVIIPADGEYTFQVRSDDGFLLRFLDPANDFTSVSGNGALTLSGKSEIIHFAGTGDSNTRGVATLTAGVHDLVFAWWEGEGGAHFEVSAAMGAFTAHNGLFRLIGDESPAGATVVGLGVTEPGWTVTHIGPNLDPMISDGFGGIGAGTFEFSINDRMDAAEGNPDNTSIHPEVHFGDNGAFYPFPGGVSWPGNTPGDDNDYAMRGTATLDIPASGNYYLGFQSDDGAYLDVIGRDWTMIVENVTGEGVLVEREPGSGVFDRMITEVGTGNSRTIGLINLPAGEYPLEFGFYERGGGSYIAVVGTDEANYETGALLIPLGVGRGGQTFTPPAGLLLASGSGGSSIRITDVSYEEILEQITIVFTSAEGTPYTVEASLDLKTWFSVVVVNGLDGATQVDIGADDLDAVFGPIERTQAFVRVRQGSN
ncbi:hypothetical protein BH23VER1_BH23VER1_12750 [soil metagenome]